MLRNSTSAPIITVMASSNMPAAVIMPFKRCPYRRDRVSMLARPATGYGAFWNSSLSFGPVAALCRMMPSQPA